MKIIHFADYFNELTGNPIQVYANEFKKKGFEVEVFTSNMVPTPAGYDDAKSAIKIKRFKGVRFFSKCFFPGVIPYFLSNVKENDIVHAHVLGFFSTFAAGYLKFFKKFKFVLTADYDPMSKEQNFLLKAFNYFFFVVPAKNADLVLCFTQKEKEKLVKRFNLSEKKIRVLPIGVYWQYFNKNKGKSFRKILGLENKFVVLSVCYLYRKKNLEMAISILKYLKEEVCLVHAGGWPDLEYKKYLEELVKQSNLENRVFFLGDKKIDEIVKIYSLADVFVNTGFNESYAIPVLEAMSSGLPVITTKVGVGKEIIKENENGFFIENKKDLLEKTRFLFENRLLCKRIGKRINTHGVYRRFSHPL
ncbi:MAG: glycosyltransferase family 4 protein [archaeon]|nr:glycosyltransferase family 4 protein [archaeon]